MNISSFPSFPKNSISLAYSIAKAAHMGQKDKAGEDYINHPLAVASFVTGPDAKIVALLHDTIEDTSVTEDDLRPLFSGEIVDAIVSMTHLKGEPYMEYIRRVSGNDLAKTVKLADLRHNMDLGRIKNPTEKDYARIERKYLPALAYLS